MPRSVQEILQHADELAARFEAYEPGPGDAAEPETFASLRQAVVAQAAAERAVGDAVERARAAGCSWASIGRVLGTSGEAARQRYGTRQDV